MKLNNDIVAGVFESMFNQEDFVHQGTQKYGFYEISSRLSYALNDILATGERMESLIVEQTYLDAQHVEDTGKIESEMVRVQENCPHLQKVR